uniref:Ring finger protein 24 n=1 Tax=Acanthochromis polyacanthus TaxID=80966 RepID=A0A3Q1EQZ9_9TELE
MSSDFPHYSFRMPNIGFQNLPLNIYIVVFGTAIFVFILSLLFCCYLIRLRHQAHKELYAYKQLRLRLKQLNSPSLFQICAVCLEEFKQKDELGICPCKHAFHRKGSPRHPPLQKYPIIGLELSSPLTPSPRASRGQVLDLAAAVDLLSLSQCSFQSSPCDTNKQPDETEQTQII